MQANKTHMLLKRKVTGVVILASSLALAACGGGGSDSSSGTPKAGTKNTNSAQLQTNAAMAKSFVDDLAVPAYTAFAQKAAGLAGSVQSYCSAIGKSNEASALTTAQNQWKALKTDWQLMQAYAVVPVANSSLTDIIYSRNSFDANTTTQIAAEVAKRKADANYTLTSGTHYKARGLDALEYLLFHSESDATKKQDNCNYAVAVAKDVKNTADALVNTWKQQRNTFLTNKEPNGVDLIQPFFDNVANLVDVTVKSNDLAIPAGLKASSSCTSSVCPELVENRLSKTSYDSIKANLQGLKTVFEGKNGNGFQKFYTQKKMTAEATAFQNSINNAIATINAQTTSLHDQLTAIRTKGKSAACTTVSGNGSTADADLAPCKLYYQVKKISDDIKTGSFKLAVNLELPAASAGDGD